MAKYRSVIHGDIAHFIDYLDSKLYANSMSLSKEEEMCAEVNDVKVVMLVYERYSYSGGNRLSLNITLVADGDDIHVLAASSGGSNGVFFKFNTWGEDNFIGVLADIVDAYDGQ